MSNKIYQLKITLNDSSPNIWRRILVPKEYTFFELHLAIQDAMGWLDCHLHGFYISQKGTSRPISIRFPDPENDFDMDSLDERQEKIADYLGKSVKQCTYTYDFGDSWDHTILLERENDAEEGKEYPICVAGKNACPPEDCGGLGGYERLQKILKNPKNKEHAEMLEWLCIDSADEFNVADFDSKTVEFEDTKERLREYEKNFKVEPLKDDPSLLDLKKLPKNGVWEIGQKQEEIFSQSMKHLPEMTLTVVVHQESYFILTMGVKSKSSKDVAKSFLLEAIEKHKFLPDTVIVKDKKLIEELKEISNTLGIKVVQGKLKAASTIFRDIKRFI